MEMDPIGMMVNSNPASDKIHIYIWQKREGYIGNINEEAGIIRFDNAQGDRYI